MRCKGTKSLCWNGATEAPLKGERWWRHWNKQARRVKTDAEHNKAHYKCLNALFSPIREIFFTSIFYFLGPEFRWQTEVKVPQPVGKESLGGITQMSDSEDSFGGVSPRINSGKSFGGTTQRDCSVTPETTLNIRGRTINAKQPPERIIEDLWT